MSVNVIYRGVKGRRVDDFTVPMHDQSGAFEAWVGDIIDCGSGLIAVLHGDPDYLIEPFDEDEWESAEEGYYAF